MKIDLEDKEEVGRPEGRGDGAYNRADTRFYRTRPSLQATALPLRLVPGGRPFGVQFGDHHTVKLR